jgi:hypothetical protein
MKNKNKNAKAPTAGQTYGASDIERMARADSLLLLEFEELRPRALFRTSDGRVHPIGAAHVDGDGYSSVYFGPSNAADDFVHRVGFF